MNDYDADDLYEGASLLGSMHCPQCDHYYNDSDIYTCERCGERSCKGCLDYTGGICPCVEDVPDMIEDEEMRRRA